jgi:hypothetical protein
MDKQWIYQLNFMAAIIQRVFSDGPNKGIALGYISGSQDNSLTRPLSVGSNWSVIRMGLLCGIGAVPSQSYHRRVGLALGFSSGSRDMANSSQARTFAGTLFGAYLMITGWTNNYMFAYNNNPTSGSYFNIDTCWIGGYSAGSLDANSSINLTTSTGNYYFANNGSVPQRRMPIILELSASSTTNLVIKVYGPTGSLQNIDYTSAQLLAALTSSFATGITGSNGVGIFASKTTTNITHNTTTYPLDTAFINWAGGMPFEVYDWYIYKVR